MSSDAASGSAKRKHDLVSKNDAASTSSPASASGASGEQKTGKKKKPKHERSVAFAFDSAELRARTRPVSINDLRQVALSVAEYMPANERPKFIATPGRSSIKRIAVLCIPGITPDIIGMATPPTFAIETPPKKLHPRSLFSGSSSSTHSNIPASPGTAAPAFPLVFASKEPDNRLPALSRLFSHGLPTRAEGEGGKIYDPVNSLLLGPGKIKKKDNSERDSSLFGEQSTTLEALLLSPAELAKENLDFTPLKTKSDAPSSSKLSSPALHRIANGWDLRPEPVTLDSDWVVPPDPTTSEGASEREKPIVLAIDCEMVDVESGKALARLAVVDFWTEELLLDQLVKPDKEVTDYVTTYSGITEALLKDVTTTLADAQSLLLSLMQDSNAILMGHHISNDLRVLKIAHTRCIDTSVIYHNLQRPSAKPGLKWLAQRWLQKSIQSTGTRVNAAGQIVEGHDPQEDARTCVGLVKLKVEQGLEFGKSPEARTSIFQRLKEGPGGGGNGKMSTAYVGGGADAYGALATSAVECEEDEVIPKLLETLQTHDFVFARVHTLADALGWTQPLPASPTSSESSYNTFLSSPSPSDLAPTLASLNAQLQTLSTSLPSSTALILYTGCSDPRPTGILNRRKAMWEAKVKSGVMNDRMPEEERWLSSDLESLDRECEKIKAGLAFFCVSL